MKSCVHYYGDISHFQHIYAIFSLQKLQAEIRNGLRIRETITKTYLIWKVKL